MEASLPPLGRKAVSGCTGDDDGGHLQLKSDTLQGIGSGLHDLLASGDRPGERDLLDVWVGDQSRSEAGITSKSLDNTRWEDLLGKLDKLEGGIGRERRWFDYYAVASKKGWDDLANGEDQGEVPWADTGNDTKRHISGGDDLVVVLNLLFWDGQGEVEAKEQADTLDFVVGEGFGLATLGLHKLGEFLLVPTIQVHVLLDQLLALLEGGLRPRGEGLVGSLHSFLDIVLAGNWDIPELLLGGGVDTIVLLLGADVLAIDNVVEGAEIDIGCF